TLQQIDDKLDEVTQGINFIKSHIAEKGVVEAIEIDPNELVDPNIQTTRGKIFKGNPEIENDEIPE
ncbi:27184_t:CDS:2, partial [Racocetra persica]